MQTAMSDVFVVRGESAVTGNIGVEHGGELARQLLARGFP